MKVKGVWARQRKKSEQASQSLKNSQTSLNDNAYYQRIIFFFFFLSPTFGQFIGYFSLLLIDHTLLIYKQFLSQSFIGTISDRLFK